MTKRHRPVRLMGATENDMISHTKVQYEVIVFVFRSLTSPVPRVRLLRVPLLECRASH